MDTAVLFETFARPQYARQVFDQIKKAKPKKLYFYSNKARVDRPDEVRNNEEIRSWVKEIDWDCELHTFFREEYVDVYTSVQGAMDWVFENEEQAIVLEDDCVPSVAFFEYCDFFLNKYKEDKSILLPSGSIAGQVQESGSGTSGRLQYRKQTDRPTSERFPGFRGRCGY